MRKLWALLYVAVLFLNSCDFADKRESEGKKKLGLSITNVVRPSGETDEMPQKYNEDAADDPAVWYNKKDSTAYIFGTDKKGGIARYSMDGKELNYYAVGNINNIDIRKDVQIGLDTVSVIAGSDRSFQGVILAELMNDGSIDESSIIRFKTSIKGDVYGFCLYHNPYSKKLYALVNSKDGELESWEISKTEKSYEFKLIESYQAVGQTEGLVADDINNKVYLGVEENGIWVMDMNLGMSSAFRIPESGPEDNKNIVMDVEGISIYKQTDSTGVLLASSQGNYTYAMFDLSTNTYLTSFRIESNLSLGIDGAEETDGLDVLNQYVPGYEKGFLVVQDGYNTDEENRDIAQNFKVIDWLSIEELLK